MTGMANDTVRIAAIPATLHRLIKVRAAEEGLSLPDMTTVVLTAGLEALGAFRAPTDSSEARPEAPQGSR